MGGDVRMRVHVGIESGTSVELVVDPLTGRMDFLGRVVNRASRVAVFADGGQIVVTLNAMLRYKGGKRSTSDGLRDRRGSTASAIRKSLSATADVQFEELGAQALKGIKDEVPLWRVYETGDPSVLNVR